MRSKKEAQELLQKIAADIAESGGRCFYVGGFVRDEILQRENDDLDIEVYGIDKDELQELLKRYGEVKEFGKSFGILQLKDYNIDFALPRKEYKSGAKHTDFVISVDPQLSYFEATSRRDITINALMKDVLSGEIIDEHEGLKDLENRVIRHVDPLHFSEDPLRVLRVARFAAQLDFSVSDETIALCSKMDLSFLSAERVLKETDKALLSKRPSIYFLCLQQMGQLAYWYPELDDLIGLAQNPNYHLEDAFEHTMMVIDQAAELKDQANRPKALMYAALCHDFGKFTKTDRKTGRAIDHEKDSEVLAEAFLKRLKMDNVTIRTVKSLCLNHMWPGQLWDRKCDKTLLSLLDKCPYREDLKWLVYADINGMIRGPKVKYPETDFISWYDECLKEYAGWLKKDHLQGKDLLELGFRPSELLNEILKKQRELEYGLPFDQALKQTMAEYETDEDKLKEFLIRKGYDGRKKSEKLLDKIKEKGFCLQLQDPRSSAKIMDALLQEVEERFAEDKTYADLDDYAREKLGEFYASYKAYLMGKRKKEESHDV